MIPSVIQEEVERLFLQNGETIHIRKATPLSGGCINYAFRLETDGPDYFLKYNHADRYPGMFEAEAKGLALLQNTKALRIPSPVFTGIGDIFSFILMEYLPQGNMGSGFWEDFGIGLAGLHRNTAASFGLDHHNYIGSLYQSNTQHVDWYTFFRQERLEPMVKMGVDSGAIPRRVLASFDHMYKRLPDLIPEEKPSLLHGDLWSGNFMTERTGSPILIDPAVYYGHRETDLAMTQLFGGFGPAFYEAYHREYPLEKGWKDRLDIHNLYSLLVHVNLFGGGYLHQVERIIQRF